MTPEIIDAVISAQRKDPATDTIGQINATKALLLRSGEWERFVNQCQATLFSGLPVRDAMEIMRISMVAAFLIGHAAAIAETEGLQLEEWFRETSVSCT